MADTKISDEAAAGTLTGAELIPGVQGGANVRTTTADIAGVVVSRARVPLTEQGSAPSAVANEAQLYALDVSGVTHFYARLSDGTSVRLTGTATAAAALGRAASAGTLGSVANADHVHDGTLITMSSVVTTDVALPNSDVVRVSSASGNRILDLGAAVTGAPRKMCDILKTNTETNTIALSPGGSQTINGGSAGVDLVLPDSDSADRPGWTVYRDTDGNFLVY